jgi:hypothetical protein
MVIHFTLRYQRVPLRGPLSMLRFAASVCCGGSEDEGEIAHSEYHDNESLTFHMLVCI